SKGVKTISVTEKTGSLVGLLDVKESEDLMITCKSGITIRMPVHGIREQGRATQGVKLIRLDDGDQIAAITKLDDNEEPETNGEAEINGEITSEINGETAINDEITDIIAEDVSGTNGNGEATDTPDNASDEDTVDE